MASSPAQAGSGDIAAASAAGQAAPLAIGPARPAILAEANASRPAAVV